MNTITINLSKKKALLKSKHIRKIVELQLMKNKVQFTEDIMKNIEDDISEYLKTQVFALSE